MGAPVGDFSAFQTVLFTFAVTVGGFLIGTFVGIVVGMVALLFGHKSFDFSLSYKYGGLPLGILAFIASSVYLGGLLARRIAKR